MLKFLAGFCTACASIYALVVILAAREQKREPIPRVFEEIPVTVAQDIGHGVTISFWRTDDSDKSAGILVRHPNQRDPDAEPCLSSITFADGKGDAWDRESWTVESRDPLTLSPSLACRICGHHGFIRGGRWVPA